MTIYTYRKGTNQFQKKVKTPTFGPILAFGVGATLLVSCVLPIGPDKTTKFLKQFTFGQFPSVAVAAETKIAGASAIVKAPQTKEEIIQASKHPEEIDHIWLRESSRGKNKVKGGLQDICEQQGKNNELGYGGMAMKLCFDSFQEAVSTVDEWLTKRDHESLCYYNQGIRTSDCNYVK